MKWNRVLFFKYLAIGLLAFLVIAQFFKIDKTNPEVVLANDIFSVYDASSDVTSVVRAACYDCHSHEVKYPWYTDVAPISWWVKSHIKNGVKHLNFSNWASYSEGKQDHKLEECVEMLEKKSMPLKSYTWMHPEAKLSDNQRDKLIEFFNSKRKK